MKCSLKVTFRLIFEFDFLKVIWFLRFKRYDNSCVSLDVFGAKT